MGSRVKVNGTSYNINYGKTKINGTVKTISKGITKIGGTARTIKFSRLPAGYTEVEYIQSSGTQYINTGVKPNPATTSIKEKLQFTSLPSGQNIAFNSGGTYDTTPAYYNPLASYSASSSATKKFRYNMTNASGWVDFQNADTNVHEIFFDAPNKKYYFDGVSRTLAGSNHTFSLNLTLFVYNRSDVAISQYSYERLYFYQIWQNTSLVRDLVPCINPSNQVGMYDLVSKQFFGNSGTGSFIAGNPV